jgi:hypothetical protein
MRRILKARLLVLGILAACSTRPSPALREPQAIHAGAPVWTETPPRATAATSSTEEAPAATVTSSSADRARATFAAWLKERMPAGGKVLDDGTAPLQVVHTAKKGETAVSIAGLYLDLTDVYFWDDLAKKIAKANPAARGTIRDNAVIEIPHLISEPYKTGDAARIGWPADRQIKGIYLRDDSHGRIFRAFEKMPARGMNAVVLDGKDYDGLFTYRSKIPLVRETGAAKGAPIRDLARLVRFAHAKGIRMVMRISCFHDPFTQPKAPKLSLKSKWGVPYPIGWLDPAGADAQNYILDIVKEALDAGFDEINLDYIRFPVQPHLGNANLPPAGPARTTAIRDFVRRVHEMTKPRGAALSLDVFGVAAFGNHPDIDNLGQDLLLLAPECEAISPMVYPSHYEKGFHGWDEPGDHPEIIFIGTKAAIDLVAKVKNGAVIRPWLQAFNWKSPTYGPKYLLEEVKHAVAAGSVGWLMWNPSQAYWMVYQALPPLLK